MVRQPVAVVQSSCITWPTMLNKFLELREAGNWRVNRRTYLDDCRPLWMIFRRRPAPQERMLSGGQCEDIGMQSDVMEEVARRPRGVAGQRPLAEEEPQASQGPLVFDRD